MKLVVAHYLRSLRERPELEAILPDLLSESGFEVLTRARRGTRQAGVDVAAVGPDPDRGGQRSLFLFSIKSGDLTREHWDSGQPQAVRPSLNEILDDYVPHRIPPHLANLPVVICVCMGGEMREDVRAQWSGFCQKHRGDKLDFAEWNGERLANLILGGVLKAELVDGEHKGLFQKALAMLDQPDVAYRHFRGLLDAILVETENAKERTLQLRKAYLCLWILFVWARDAGNLEAAYRGSELLLLRSWPYCDRARISKRATREERSVHLDQVLKLHLAIADLLLVKKIGPFADRQYAISMAVASRNAVDINLALYELLGRLSMHGLWLELLRAGLDSETLRQEAGEEADKVIDLAIRLLNANPILHMPVRDDFAIEIALFMRLADQRGRLRDVSGFILGMSDHLCHGLATRRHYPTHATAYREVLAHPVDGSDAYFHEHTKAGILYVLVLAWLSMMGDDERAGRLRASLLTHAPDMTHQIWIPEQASDGVFWQGERGHGLAVPGLPLDESLQAVFDILNLVMEKHPLHEAVSAVRLGLTPMLLAACRHYRMPVPVHLWRDHGSSEAGQTQTEGPAPDADG